MLQTILSPKWTASSTFEVDLGAWELSLRRYEDAASVAVPDTIKCAVVVQHVPKAIKHFLKMIPTDVIYNYAVLRSAIFSYLTCDRAFTAEGMPIRDDDAMM
eukprot:5192580-Heterocapsa_arctica.AAC.1